MTALTAAPAAADSAPAPPARKPRLATMWLGGCSGCHMSFLDLDEKLLDLAAAADVVFSPIADAKAFPEDVDVTLVEGAIANEDHVHMITAARERSKLLIALGDCAVTGNVTALRNLLPVQNVLQAAYVERASTQPQLPDEPGIVPRLLPRVEPLHRVVKVDAFLPGCPPSADQIWTAVSALLRGGRPQSGPPLAPAAPGTPAPKFG